MGHLNRGEVWIIRLTSWFSYETACRCVCVCDLLPHSPAPLLPRLGHHHLCPDNWGAVCSPGFTLAPYRGCQRDSVRTSQIMPLFFTLRKAFARLPWLRIRLPMQGTQVRSLVCKNFTCLGATKLMGHKLLSPHSRAQALRK